MSAPLSTLEWAERLRAEGQAFCLGVVVAKSGSAPQGPGAKGLFLPDGRVIGTLGGGCLEMEARRLALDLLRSGGTAYREFQLDDDFGWDDGLICGGRVRVFLHPRPGEFMEAVAAANEARRSGGRGALVYVVSGPRAGRVEWVPADTPSPALPHPEGGDVVRTALDTGREVLSGAGEGTLFVEPILPPERLLIFGAGHLGAELCRLGARCGFHVIVVDDRAAFANRDRLPDAHEVLVEHPEEAARRLPADDRTYVCVVTRGHRGDAKVLRELIRRPVAYLGMIGSRRKEAVMRAEFLEQGVCTEEEWARVRSPMGLDIGSETVAEICVSILAEILQVRAARRGPLLARCGRNPLQVS